MPYKQPTITSALDIPNLPWRGNYAADEHLFQACDAYIASIKGDTQSARRLRYQAEYLTTLHGMGIVIEDNI
jgi:hypothetical protein